ncbi:MAG: hypothetical protein KIT73_04230 [Burkholderiales bacterium]|nr:hypothetical protein [Burkholderiales bacterium]
MGKRTNIGLLDAALHVIKTGVSGLGPCDKMTICSTEPTSFAEANATYALADVALTGTDFTLANGDGGGTTPRKVTVAAKSGITVDVSGTGTHVALIDTANSELLEVTTCTSQPLTAGNTLGTPAWKIELGAPT